jgi:hypothetical protein
MIHYSIKLDILITKIFLFAIEIFYFLSLTHSFSAHEIPWNGKACHAARRYRQQKCPSYQKQNKMKKIISKKKEWHRRRADVEVLLLKRGKTNLIYFQWWKTTWFNLLIEKQFKRLKLEISESQCEIILMLFLGNCVVLRLFINVFKKSHPVSHGDRKVKMKKHET